MVIEWLSFNLQVYFYLNMGRLPVLNTTTSNQETPVIENYTCKAVTDTCKKHLE